MKPPLSLSLLLILTLLHSSTALNFLFNYFNATSQLILTNDTVLDSQTRTLRLTNDSNQYSTGRIFHKTQFITRPDSNQTGSNKTRSFSTQFVFSILPEISTSPGFGLVFVLTNLTDPIGALSGQYLGVFNNDTVASVAPLFGVEFDTGRNPEFNDPDANHVGIDFNNIESKDKNSLCCPTGLFSTQFVFFILPEMSTSPGFGLVFVLTNLTDPIGALSDQYLGVFNNDTAASVAPLVGVEFDTGRNPEFNDPDTNHVGIDLNNIESKVTESGGYYNSTGGLTPLNMRNGQNIHAWIEFDGPKSQINVTIAPAGTSRPSKPLLSYQDPTIADYFSAEMYIGFSASKTTWVETQRILAWSFSDTGVAKDINTTNLPVFRLKIESSSLSGGAIASITVGCFFGFMLLLLIFYFLWKKYLVKEEKDDVVEDWELEYWPHRYSYEELREATNGFSKDELLGAGGFGKVYKATFNDKNNNKNEVAVKCVNHDSNQGLREFMAEISSIGRLQHKNLVQMRGWCRKGNELMLVYDYMPNGSLNRWIFDKPEKVMGWENRRRVLADVAEGLNYLHNGWDQVVIHRDIKSSNVLLDYEMRGRLGDFGLAKLYTHGEVPNTTRVVGTLGYLAPEVAMVQSPTAASDVYSFGVVVLEVACGRRPIDSTAEREEDVLLIDWVREKYTEGNIADVADRRIEGEYEVAEMEAILKLGLACCHPEPVHRPNMRVVVAVLLGDDLAGVPSVMLSELEDINIGGDEYWRR